MMGRLAFWIWLVFLLGTAVPQEPLYQARVVRVVDGDTLVVRTQDGATLKVRLIGVDTPEIRGGKRLEGQVKDLRVRSEALKEVGHQASTRVRAIVDGKDVWLEYDVGRKDRFGRTLAYVWTDQGPHMLNELLLEEGLGRCEIVEPNRRYQERFDQVSRIAREARRGLWSQVAGVSDPSPEEEPTGGLVGGQVIGLIVLGVLLLGFLIILIIPPFLSTRDAKLTKPESNEERQTESDPTDPPAFEDRPRDLW